MKIVFEDMSLLVKNSKKCCTISKLLNAYLRTTAAPSCASINKNLM